MARCGITTIASLKQAIKDIPDDYIFGTNHIGNIALSKATGDDRLLEMVGYIELMNLEFYDGSNLHDCELRILDDGGAE